MCYHVKCQKFVGKTPSSYFSFFPILCIIVECTCSNSAFPTCWHTSSCHGPIRSNWSLQNIFLHGLMSGVSSGCPCILTPLWLALQLDIVQRQYIHQAGLKQSDLVKVAFSARGTWLATVEESEEVADPELQLKLWFYSEETQR